MLELLLLWLGRRGVRSMTDLCPRCKSDDIIVEDSSCKDGFVIRACKCYACDCLFKEVYSLDRVEIE